MTLAYSAGIYAALVKFAFNESDAAKVLGIAKKKQIDVRAMPAPMQAAGLQMLPARKALASPKARAFSEEQQKMLPPEIIEALKPLQQQYDALSKRLPHGAIATPGGQKATHTLSDVAGVVIPSSQRKMMEAITKGHELDELHSAHNLSGVFADKGHASPEVLLKEHNRLVTLPPGYEAVQQVMRNARSSFGETDRLGTAGVTYGTGPRLSRHARKRITENLEQKFRNR